MSIAALPSLIDELREIVGQDAVLSAHSDLLVYECDAFVIEKKQPRRGCVSAQHAASGRCRPAS